MPKTFCLNCEEPISVLRPRLDAVVTCPECGTEMQVTSVIPFELDFPAEDDWEEEEEEDDWEDDEE